MKPIAFLLFANALCYAQQASFHRQIKPVLDRNCAGCHQSANLQSGLLLTSHAAVVKGGRKGPGVVRGDPSASILLKYLTGEMKPQMPFGSKPLPDEQIELFRRWIAEGAIDDTPADDPNARKPTVYRTAPVINALALNGNLLAVSGYREIFLYDLENGLKARLPGKSERILSLAFSPDGARLAAVGGNPSQFGELQIWDVTSNKQLHSAVDSSDTFFGVSFSPDGSKIAFAAADKSVRLFDAATGKLIRKMDHHEDWSFATVFGVDGKRLVSVGRDRAAKISQVETGAFIENVNLLREPLSAVARHPRKDWIAIGGQDRIPYLYMLDRPRAMRIADDSTLIRKFDPLDGPVLALAISPDGTRLAAAAETGDVRVYNLDTGDRVARCSGHRGGIYTLLFTAKGDLITAGFDGKIRIYDPAGTIRKEFVAAPVDNTQVSEGRR